AAGALRREYSHPHKNLPLDRIDERVRPCEPGEYPLIEPPEPGKLQKLRLGQIEDESGDAETEQLRKDEHGRRRDPFAFRQQPEFEELQRQQEDERHREDDQGRGRREVADRVRDPLLEPLKWNARDDPGDERRKVLPQPSLKEEHHREEDQETTFDGAHLPKPFTSGSARRFHLCRENVFQERWIAGSSPTMTVKYRRRLMF